MVQQLVCLLITRFYKKLVDLGEIGKVSISKESSYDTIKKDSWGAFAKLSIVMFGRSVIYYGLNTFLVLFWIQILGQSETIGNATLSVYYGFGALCTLLGGKLADKYGYRLVIKIGFVILFPTIVLLAMSSNVYLATMLLLPMGVAIQMVYSPMVVLGQQYLPNHVGLASGVTLGLAVSIGGIFAPCLGIIADRFGLITTMYVIAAIAVIPMVVAFILPSEKKEG